MIMPETERRVLCPMFLEGLSKLIVTREMMSMGHEFHAKDGDQVAVKYGGMTKDPQDGWPMKILVLTFIRKED